MKLFKCINGHFFKVRPVSLKYNPHGSVYCPVCGSRATTHLPVYKDMTFDQMVAHYKSEDP